MPEQEKKLSYKERNGTSFVGDALRKITGVAPDILELAGSVTGIKALSNLGQKIAGTDTISEQDKEIILKELEKDIAVEIEITKRWVADANSDNWLSKNVRPSICFLYTFATLIFIFCDSYFEGFNVSEQWITILLTNTGLINTAYFGSRYLEKRDTKKYK